MFAALLSAQAPLQAYLLLIDLNRATRERRHFRADSNDNVFGVDGLGTALDKIALNLSLARQLACTLDVVHAWLTFEQYRGREREVSGEQPDRTPRAVISSDTNAKADLEGRKRETLSKERKERGKTQKEREGENKRGRQRWKERQKATREKKRTRRQNRQTNGKPGRYMGAKRENSDRATHTVLLKEVLDAARKLVNRCVLLVHHLGKVKLDFTNSDTCQGKKKAIQKMS